MYLCRCSRSAADRARGSRRLRSPVARRFLVLRAWHTAQVSQPSRMLRHERPGHAASACCGHGCSKRRPPVRWTCCPDAWRQDGLRRASMIPDDGRGAMPPAPLRFVRPLVPGPWMSISSSATPNTRKSSPGAYLTGASTAASRDIQPVGGKPAVAPLRASGCLGHEDVARGLRPRSAGPCDAVLPPGPRCPTRNRAVRCRAREYIRQRPRAGASARSQSSDRTPGRSSRPICASFRRPRPCRINLGARRPGPLAGSREDPAFAEAGSSSIAPDRPRARRGSPPWTPRRCGPESANSRGGAAAYVIFDVEIRDPIQYQVFMQGVKPALEEPPAAGTSPAAARKGVRRRLASAPDRALRVPVPVQTFESFYDGPVCIAASSRSGTRAVPPGWSPSKGWPETAARASAADPLSPRRPPRPVYATSPRVAAGLAAVVKPLRARIHSLCALALACAAFVVRRTAPKRFSQKIPLESGLVAVVLEGDFGGPFDRQLLRPRTSIPNVTGDDTTFGHERSRPGRATARCGPVAPLRSTTASARCHGGRRIGQQWRLPLGRRLRRGAARGPPCWPVSAGSRPATTRPPGCAACSTERGGDACPDVRADPDGASTPLERSARTHADGRDAAARPFCPLPSRRDGAASAHTVRVPSASPIEVSLECRTAEHCMKLVVRPTPEQWPDLEAIFGAPGCSVARGCWCMFYRRTGRPADLALGESSSAQPCRTRAWPRQTRHPALIGYAGRTPVGWVSLGPREDFQAAALTGDEADGRRARLVDRVLRRAFSIPRTGAWPRRWQARWHTRRSAACTCAPGLSGRQARSFGGRRHGSAPKGM